MKDYQVLETFQTWMMKRTIMQQAKQSVRWEAVVGSGICFLSLDVPLVFKHQNYVTESSVDSTQPSLDNLDTFYTHLYVLPLLS